jgi:Domain of unknown function (DUF5655)
MAQENKPTLKGWGTMIDQAARLLRERTGASMKEWNERVRETGISDEHELRSWLEKQGVTGYPQMMLINERFGYPDFLLADPEDLIDGQYTDRKHLRPILDAVLAAVSRIDDVTIQARKTYVSLVSPKRTFAMVKPTTKDRVDLGLKLPDQRPGGRLLTAKSLEQGNLRVALRSPDDVDEEVVKLLQQAYDVNS